MGGLNLDAAAIARRTAILRRLEAGLAAVCPIHGIRPPEAWDGASAAGVSIDFRPEAAPAEQAAAAAVLAAFDWTEQAQAAFEAAREKSRAAASLTGGDAETRRLRNALRVVFAALVETRQALNEARTALALSPLPNRTWPQMLAAAAGQIQAETDPAA